MIVKKFIEKMRTKAEIEFRDEEGYIICRANNKSIGIKPYLDNEITEWFPCSGSVIPSLNSIDVVVYIHLEDKNNEENDNKEDAAARI